MSDLFRRFNCFGLAAVLLFVGMGQISIDMNNSLPDAAEADAATAEPEAAGDAARDRNDARPQQRRARLDPVKTRAYWSKPGEAGDGMQAVAVVFDIDPPFHINPDKANITPGFDFLIPTTITPENVPEGVTLGGLQFPPTHEVPVDLFGTSGKVAVHEGQVVVYLPVQGASPDTTFDLKIRYQACDPKKCLQPVTETITVTAEEDSPEASPTGASPAGATPAGMSPAGMGVADARPTELFASFDPPAATASFEAGGFDAIEAVGDVAFDIFGLKFSLNPSGMGGLIALMLVAALGGMMLNFTPCVLPVIPLKIMSLSHVAGSRGKCLLLGSTMSLGVILFWLVLGACMALISGFTATNELFKYPVFTLSVGIIIAVLAVGMCGLFTIQLPVAVYSYTPRQDTVTGSVGFGVMTAVLSTPCTAPLMGAAAAWAATQTPAVTMMVFCAIGVGMALPYFVLSAFPKLVEKVPRSGPGSVLVKQVMGLLMLAVAAFFIGIGVSGWLTSAGDPPNTLYWWVVVALVSAAGIWLVWRVFEISESNIKKAAATIVAVLSLAISGYVGASMTATGIWQYYTPDRFDAALDRGDVVVLDFTAEWCLNCKVLEKTVLANERVESLLTSDGVVPMKVDLTPSDNADAAAMLEKMNRVTIPLLVVLDPDGNEVFKSDAYTPQQVIDAINAAKGEPD